MKNIALLLTILLFQHLVSIAQNNDYYNPDYLRFDNVTYKKNIHTVKMHHAGNQLSYPIINLHGDAVLELSFDDFEQEIKTYNYTVIHCDVNWKPSDLLQTDYINGYYEEEIRDYEYSFNTLQSYTHYSVKFPNENMQASLSGNYVIKVYEDYDPEQVVLTRRFSIVDTKIGIDVNIHRATWVEDKKGGQEVDVVVQSGAYTINNPDTELHLVIAQNNRWDKKIDDLKPKFIKQNTISYDYDKENVFDGLNEFRFFDCKNVRFQSIRVQKILFERPHYTFILRPDAFRTKRTFSYHEDINGHQFVQIEQRKNSETNADYVYVHFILPIDAPFVNEEVYIMGEFSDWKTNEENKMKYNLEHKVYEKKILLKQGYYNYMYALLRKGNKIADESYFEGNHYQAENNYVIYVYHRDISSRYDKLIGVSFANSMKKL